MRARRSSFATAGSASVRAVVLILLVLGMAQGASGKGPRRGAVKATPAVLREKVQAALARSDFAEAHKLVDDSYRQAPQPEKLFLLAQVAQAEGQAQAARDLFRRFLADMGTEGPQSQKLAQSAVAGPLLPSGEVNVEGDRGALVYVDDHPVGVLPLLTPLWLSTGAHKISVLSGSKRQEEQYKVLAARKADLRFNLSSDVVVATLQPAALLVLFPTASEGQKTLSLSPDEVSALEQGAQSALSGKPLGLQTQAAALLAAPHLANCLADWNCQKTLGEENQANWLLLLSVEVTQRWRGARDLKLRLAAHDPAIAEPAASAERMCTACTADKAKQIATELFGVVVPEATSRPRGTLIVQSVPDGAEVHLGARLMGHTPLKRTVWAGTYPLVISKRGFSPLQREVTVTAGQRQTVEVTLLLGTLGDATKVPSSLLPEYSEEPSNPAKTAAGLRPRWRIVTGASAVVLGAVTVGFGISALAVNNHCVAGLQDASMQCGQIYDTLPPGAALTSVGGVALLAGSMLLAWPG